MELELSKYIFLGEKFVKAPIEERVFFIKAMSLLTEINLYQKHYLFSVNQKDTVSPGVKTSAQNIQAMYLVKNLAGVLWEGYQVIQKEFFGKGLRAIYYNEFDQKTKESMDAINSKDKELARKLLDQIRNNFAFHLDTDNGHIEKLVRDFSEKENLELYFAQEHGNSYYQGASYLLIHAMMGLTVENDSEKAIDKIMETVVGFAKVILDFLGGFVMAFILKHQKENLNFEPVTISDVEFLSQVRLPFFAINDSRKKKS